MLQKHTHTRSHSSTELTWGHQLHSSALSLLDPGSSSCACSSSVHRCRNETGKGINAHTRACMLETMRLVFKLVKSFQVSRPVSRVLQLDPGAEDYCRAALRAKCYSTHTTLIMRNSTKTRRWMGRWRKERKQNIKTVVKRRANSGLVEADKEKTMSAENSLEIDWKDKVGSILYFSYCQQIPLKTKTKNDGVLPV